MSLSLIFLATVFGMPLNQPLTVPECLKDAPAYVSKDIPEIPGGYSATQTRVCSKSYPTTGENSVFLDFPPQLRPAIMGSATAEAIIKDGALVGIEFNTLGITDQESVLRELSSKYGKPTILTRPVAQTARGASFQKLHAIWRLPDVYVDFDSAPLKIDLGEVTIETTAAKQMKDSSDAKAAASRIGL